MERRRLKQWHHAETISFIIMHHVSLIDTRFLRGKRIAAPWSVRRKQMAKCTVDHS
jgi:hypothetical protein